MRKVKFVNKSGYLAIINVATPTQDLQNKKNHGKSLRLEWLAMELKHRKNVKIRY